LSPLFVLRLPLHQQALEGVLGLEPQEGRRVDNGVVEGDEGAKDGKVAPFMRIVDAEPLAELVACRVLAELTQSIRGNLHVASRLSDVGLRVGVAGFAGRGAKAGEFVLVASDGFTVDDRP